MACPECDDGDYPDYGLAPHRSFGVASGDSCKVFTEWLPESEWPDNYIPDPECPGMGTYVCPACKGVPQ